jgi:nitrogen fixation NifU-like protein
MPLLSYNKKVMKEFMNPKNMGEIKNPDGTGKVGNPTCGDIMEVYIKVKKDKKGKEIIKDIKFKTFGCAAAIATSSMITKLTRGKSINDAEKINYKDIVNALGGLPNIKIHCSTMANQALKRAIEDYKNNSSEKKGNKK